GRILALPCEKSLGVLTFQHHCQIAGIQLARGGFRRPDVRHRLDCRQAADDVLGRANLGIRISVSTDRQHCKTVPQGDVVPNLVQSPSWKFEARSIKTKGMAKMNKPRALIDRENVLHAVSQALCDIACVIRKGLCGVARQPPAKAVLKGFRQIPVIQGSKWLYAIFYQLIDQPIVEIETLWIGRAGPFREDTRPRD